MQAAMLFTQHPCRLSRHGCAGAVAQLAIQPHDSYGNAITLTRPAWAGGQALNSEAYLKGAFRASATLQGFYLQLPLAISAGPQGLQATAQLVAAGVYAVQASPGLAPHDCAA